MKYIHWQIRPPAALAKQISELAATNRRSINGQVIFMLEQYLLSSSNPKPQEPKPESKK